MNNLKDIAQQLNTNWKNGSYDPLPEQHIEPWQLEVLEDEQRWKDAQEQYEEQYNKSSGHYADEDNIQHKEFIDNCWVDYDKEYDF